MTKKINDDLYSNIVAKLDRNIVRSAGNLAAHQGIFREYTKVKDLAMELTVAIHMRVHWATKTKNWNT